MAVELTFEKFYLLCRPREERQSPCRIPSSGSAFRGPTAAVFVQWGVRSGCVKFMTFHQSCLYLGVPQQLCVCNGVCCRRGYDIPSILSVSPGAIAAVCLHAVVGSVHVVSLLNTSLSYIVTFTFFQCVCIYILPVCLHFGVP